MRVKKLSQADLVKQSLTTVAGESEILGGRGKFPPLMALD